MALVLDGLGATPWVLALLYFFAMVFIGKPEMAGALSDQSQAMQ